MIKVGIIGATGYTGVELLRILLSHPQVEVVYASSESYAGKEIGEVFPSFRGRTLLTLEKLDAASPTDRSELIFSCLPHEEAMTRIPHWLKKGARVIDLSADFRFRSEAVYERWYHRHTAPELLREAVYGLPELYRDKIRNATLVGNPGCYPTGALLGLIPLIRNKLISTDHIVVDSKSGVTGAGRKAAVENLFSEVSGSVHAYQVGRHRHTPEIEQELSLLAHKEVRITFTPHLIPMDRGILSTLYAPLLKTTETSALLKIFADEYSREPFVRVLPEGLFPKTKEVRGTNECRIGLHADPRTGQVVVVTAIDNLMKGASSQAVQNMNLLCGFPEETALQLLALIP